MANGPNVGDEIVMDSMGSDVLIEVAEVPEDQPLVDTDGYHIIVDQYGDEHLVELDGDTWVTGSVDALSPEGSERWHERFATPPSASTAPKP